MYTDLFCEKKIPKGDISKTLRRIVMGMLIKEEFLHIFVQLHCTFVFSVSHTVLLIIL